MSDSKEAEIRAYYKEQRRLDREASGPRLERRREVKKDNPHRRNNFYKIDQIIDTLEEYPDHDE